MGVLLVWGYGRLNKYTILFFKDNFSIRYFLKDRQHQSLADIAFSWINQQLRGLEYCFIYQMKGYLILYFGIYYMY